MAYPENSKRAVFAWTACILMNLSCAREETSESEQAIRKGSRVSDTSTGPEHISTVGISTGCTGTVIADFLILTAAHCVTDRAMFVVFRTDMHEEGRGQVISVEQKLIHSQYTPNDPYIAPYDIAILRLSEKIPNIYRPIRLLRPMDSLIRGEAVIQAGYGETIRRGGQTFGRLRFVLNIFEGWSSHGRLLVSDDRMKGTCAGDSGGPLFVDRGREWFVAGVLSGGSESEDYGCLGGGTYTGVAEFHSWITRASESLRGKLNP